MVEALLLTAARGRRLVAANGDDGEETSARGIYYVASAERPTFVELGGLVAEALGRPPARMVVVPTPACFALAGLATVAARLRGRPTLRNIDKAREAAAGSWTCDPTRARRDLGFTPAESLAARLRQTAQ